MAEFTPNINLYKWQITDEIEETFQQYRVNADKLDGEINSLKSGQGTLYSGFMFLQDGQSVNPTKNLAACRNGWILVWSDFDPSPLNTVNNWDFVFTYIPKRFAQLHPGAQVLANIPITQSATTLGSTIKKFNINDTTIIGDAANSSATINANDVVLRYVLEW
ncbi:MAG: hypothetical protein ACJ8MO_22680 [Bacillus sp. (in: firmicutes)]